MPLAASETVSSAAGPVGLLLVVLIGVALALLIRNMDHRLKRLPRDFPEDGHGVRRAEPGEDPDARQG